MANKFEMIIYEDGDLSIKNESATYEEIIKGIGVVAAIFAKQEDIGPEAFITDIIGVMVTLLKEQVIEKSEKGGLKN